MAVSLSQVDLAALRLFLAVAQTGKISAGAMICHLSVAAASKRISDMELRLGYSLFDRHARGVVATAAGERVMAYASEVIGLTQALENDLSDEMQGIEGSVRLFANSSAIVQFLPADLSGFLAGNPSIRVELSEHTSRGVVDALLTERSDLGIFEGSFASAGIHSVPYRRDQLALIVPPGHGLSRRRVVRFEQVLDSELVALPADTAIQRQLMRSAAALGRQLRTRISVHSFDAVCSLVAAGAGIGVVPRLAAHMHARLRRLHCVSLSDPWAERTLLLGWPRLRPPSPGTQRLTRYLQEAARNG
jgi:DNA-binding transcriptional LysR family regulator